MKLSYKRCRADVPVGVLRCLKRRMRWVRAAGCVLQDEAGHLLLIRRNNRWDLPKGKVEAGETLLTAALREANEETGLGVHALPGASPILKTYHIYNLYGGWHLKQTTWYNARCAGVEPAGSPQREEGITDVVWVAPDVWRRRLQKSYGTLKTVAGQWTKSVR